MFHTLGIKSEQVYGDVYASWLRDTFEKNTNDTKQLFRDMVEAGFLDRQVILRRQRLGMNVASSLATALHRTPLTKLDLHANALRDIGCEVIAHLMPDLPHLTYLDLGANGLTGAGARNLGLAVAQHPKLAVLILSSRRAEDPYANDLNSGSTGTTVLLHGCLRSRSLRQLDLSGNQLGDAGVGTAGASRGGGEEKGKETAGSGGGDNPLEGLTSALEGGGRSDEGEADAKEHDAGTGEQPQTPVELLCQILSKPTGSLSTLRLSDVGLTAHNACRLIQALRTNNSLTLLDVSENHLPSLVGDALGRLLLDRVAMQSNSVLHSLHLSGNPLFTSDTGDTVAGGLVGRKLQSALAAGNSAREGASGASPSPAPSLLLSSLAHDRGITTLALDRCHIDTAALHSLCRALHTNSALRSLSLRHNDITADAAVELGRALCRHPCLQKLFLAGNTIGDEGACALAAVIEGDRGLPLSGGDGVNRISLSETSMDGASAATAAAAGAAQSSGREGAPLAFAAESTTSAGMVSASGGPGRSVSFSPETLRSKKGQANAATTRTSQAATPASSSSSTLEVLDLQHTWLGDRGLIALGVALQGNDTLRALHLSGNHFTSQGGESFAALLEKNTSVVRCELGATSVPCPTVLRLERCVARNRHKLEHAESDGLRREVIRLHFQKYKLEEAKLELESLRERSATTKNTAENYELQFKQDQSDYAKKLRELEEQMENYVAQEAKYQQQCAQLEVDLKKTQEVFEEDMALTKERLDAETRNREAVEQEHRALEAELEEWKGNGQGRESAKRAQLASLQEEMRQWANQGKQYRQEAEQLAKEVKELEAKAAALGAGGAGSGAGKKGKKRSSSVKGGKASVVA